MIRSPSASWNGRPFELLLAGDQEQRPGETEFVPSGVIEVVEGMYSRQP
jgi:hypothetical protein